MLQAVKKITTYFFVMLLSVCTLVWLLSPYILPHIINPILAPYQLALDEGTSIRYNPITAHIDIDDLGISTISSELNKNEKEQVFALKDLEFEIRLYQFLFDEIYISELYIDGLLINITQSNNQTFIAGVNVSEDDTNQAGDEELSKENNDASPQEPEAFPYKLFLPNVEIKSSQVNLSIDDENHKINFKAFHMTEMVLALDEQHLDFNIESEVDDADFNLALKGDFSGVQGEYIIDLDIQHYQLSRVAKHMGLASNALQGEVSYAANHTLRYNEGTFDINVPVVKLLLNDAIYQEKEHQYELSSAELELTKLMINFTDITEIDLTGEGELSLAAFKSVDKTNKDIVAMLTSLQLSNIMLQSIKSQPQIDIENAAFDSFKFSQTPLPNTPALASFKQLLLEEVQITDKSLHINKVKLSGVNLDAHINKNKKLINLIDGLQSKPVENADVTVQEKPELLEQAQEDIAIAEKELSQNFVMKVNSLLMSDNAYISFWDESVTPNYQREITINTFTVGTIDNTKPNAEIPISIKGSSDKYAKLEANILAKPFLALSEYKFDSKINEVSLPGVSPYLVDALGYEIKSGQLDLSVKGILKGTIIDSNVDMFLRGIALQKPEELEGDEISDNHTEQNKSKDASVVPFDTALNLLKDSNDNVTLSLPITGDTTDPSFGLSGFISLIIKKSVALGAREYLIAAVVPYASVVSIAYSAVGDDLLRVKFKPLEYEPKQIEVEEEHHEFASQFAGLLKEKPDIHVKVCAGVIPEDIDKERTDKLSKEDRKALIHLAKERADEFKDYMIQEEGVSSSRILFCKPSINQDKDATSQLIFTH